MMLPISSIVIANDKEKWRRVDKGKEDCGLWIADCGLQNKEHLESGKLGFLY